MWFIELSLSAYLVNLFLTHTLILNLFGHICSVYMYTHTVIQHTHTHLLYIHSLAKLLSLSLSLTHTHTHTPHGVVHPLPQ